MCQASGEALFVNDMPKFQHELYAAFVVTEVGSALLGSVDASEAMVRIHSSQSLQPEDQSSNKSIIQFLKD